uniref:Uncharacterized protein n=1 Tax=Plectus sambesii TaxID=2011161 RepID=A0A914W0G8_9BILA
MYKLEVAAPKVNGTFTPADRKVILLNRRQFNLRLMALIVKTAFSLADHSRKEFNLHAEEEEKGDNQELEGFASNHIGTGEESEGGLSPEDIEGAEEMAVALEMVASVIEAGAAAVGVIATSLDAGVKTQNVAEAEAALGTNSALPLGAIRDDVLIEKQETTNPEHEQQKLKTEQFASQLEVLVAVMESAAAAVAIAGAAVANDVIHKEKELFKASHGNENISPAIIGAGG